MKKILFSLVCSSFSSNEIKAYPPGHYKSCQTGNQHIYQQAACKALGLCRW
ncbi:hypothetical protein GZ520_001738 [Campylobacter upsaliensis]|uniref:hypothetical protein n=1 Tax=Campylobacter upsaliensis TaxID=28080 RepID=UPI0014144CD7|nr:hypothetical protein [Campylobacter upsaliensis]EDP6921335.1 hypothetical protein [Campylobacter upsaliensis]EDP6922520.1 hypothetical protein [Campylobacter upsaliensis]EGB2777999.1 hypothetical protein [Campylobacter upsaliensis]EGB2779108.1 hypothetical protein [Campylobacter upsaliensis]EGJ6309052.1 hypothetical protein [Campylobacter upsaliensis]